MPIPSSLQDALQIEKSVERIHRVRAYIKSDSGVGRLAWLVGLFSALAVAVGSYQLPQNNWDMLGHLGGALHFGIEDPVQLHRETYELAKQTLPADKFLELTDGNKERKAWSSDPQAFLQVLPFYEPRVLVTLPTYAAYKVGVNPIFYMRLQSSVAAGLGVLLFTLILAGYSHALLVFLMPFLALISGVLEVARFEGADALSFFGYAIVVFLFLKRSWWTLAILVLLPLTRSDMIIYCVPALIYFACVFRERLLLVALAIAACLAVFLGVNYAFDNYGWTKQFYVVHMQYLSYPADTTVSFSFYQYITAVLRGTVHLIINYHFQFFFLMAVIVCSACYMRLRDRGICGVREEYALGLCILSIFFVIAHFLVFPIMHTRYFVGQYLHVIVFAAAVVSKWAYGYRLAHTKQ